jgi:hypothetical protein
MFTNTVHDFAPFRETTGHAEVCLSHDRIRSDTGSKR